MQELVKERFENEIPQGAVRRIIAAVRKAGSKRDPSEESDDEKKKKDIVEGLILVLVSAFDAQSDKKRLEEKGSDTTQTDKRIKDTWKEIAKLQDQALEEFALPFEGENNRSGSGDKSEETEKQAYTELFNEYNKKQEQAKWDSWRLKKNFVFRDTIIT